MTQLPHQPKDDSADNPTMPASETGSLHRAVRRDEILRQMQLALSARTRQRRLRLATASVAACATALGVMAWIHPLAASPSARRTSIPVARAIDAVIDPAHGPSLITRSPIPDPALRSSASLSAPTTAQDAPRSVAPTSASILDSSPVPRGTVRIAIISSSPVPASCYLNDDQLQALLRDAHHPTGLIRTPRGMITEMQLAAMPPDAEQVIIR